MSDPVRDVDSPDLVVPRSPRSTRLGDEREHEILRATYALLAEVGYEGLRLDAVAARARASKATLYRHWPGKAQLVADAVRSCQASRHQPPDTGSLRGDLVAMLNVMASSMTQDDGPLFAGLVMAMQNDPELAAEVRRNRASGATPAAAIHANAVNRGELDPDSNPQLIDEIAPAVMFMRCFALGEPIDEAFIDHLVDDILLPLLSR
ncbi:MAG TPA: TetR/AcrR family transcriptional regulator [Micromonosporaceae bacterium]|nr:TetR/AcrR family transcriptional regulator [Micromonosporaceae bacterium]